MNYQDEIIKIVRTITQEHILRFIYSILRIVSENLNDYECVFQNLSKSFSSANRTTAFASGCSLSASRE